EPSTHGMNAFCLGVDTWYDQEWLKLAEWYRNAGQLDRAVAYAERARECKRPRSPGQIVAWIGDLETMQTERLVKDGHHDEAMPHFAHAEGQFQTAVRLGYQKAAMQSR